MKSYILFSLLLFCLTITITKQAQPAYKCQKSTTVLQKSVDARLTILKGFQASVIATIPAGPRELVALPCGDLIAGTNGDSVYIVPNAEASGSAGTPAIFATFPESPAAGVTYGGGSIFIGTRTGVYRIPYKQCARNGNATKISSVRTGPTPSTDGHVTTAVAVSGADLYVSVGSSCNACTETDPTRASVMKMKLDGSNRQIQAKRWRNCIALATHGNGTGAVWGGGAGQDDLPTGHPYEYMDAVSNRPLNSDYGWPECEENRTAYVTGANCSRVVVPSLVFPAYSTIIGAAFYPENPGKLDYVFPSQYHGGLFVGLHGAWHQTNGVYLAPPRVAYVPFRKTGTPRMPLTAVNWANSSTQWKNFFAGFMTNSGTQYIGRPTGVAVGHKGSLFVADDQTGNIYRIRPT